MRPSGGLACVACAITVALLLLHNQLGGLLDACLERAIDLTHVVFFNYRFSTRTSLPLSTVVKRDRQWVRRLVEEGTVLRTLVLVLNFSGWVPSGLDVGTAH
jgi:hypothetical protein